MKTGTSMQRGRISPLRQSLIAATAPEPFKRKQHTEVQLLAGYVKWLEWKHPYKRIAAVLGVEKSFVQSVVGMISHRKVPAIQPPAEVLERFSRFDWKAD